MNLTKHLDKFLKEHNEFIKSLSAELGYPDNEAKTIHILRSVLITLRDRLTMQHSLHLLSSLPEFLKLYYIDGWKYHQKPVRHDSTEEFCKAVETELQRIKGKNLKVDKITNETVNAVLNSLRTYLDEAFIRKLYAELPPELYPLFEKEGV